MPSRLRFSYSGNDSRGKGLEGTGRRGGEGGGKGGKSIY